jgi:gamma-glutamyltranspeptidase
LNTYDFGDNIFEAVKAPRIHHQLLPNEIGVEDGYNETITHDLSKLGHKVDYRKKKKFTVVFHPLTLVHVRLPT